MVNGVKCLFLLVPQGSSRLGFVVLRIGGSRFGLRWPSNALRTCNRDFAIWTLRGVAKYNYQYYKCGPTIQAIRLQIVRKMQNIYAQKTLPHLVQFNIKFLCSWKQNVSSMFWTYKLMFINAILNTWMCQLIYHIEQYKSILPYSLFFWKLSSKLKALLSINHTTRNWKYFL
jgi:hypothetical protein